MSSYPITFVEDVFESPDAVREFALEQKYESFDKVKNYPGKRTDPISEICPELDGQIISTIISQFYDIRMSPVEIDADSYFHIIPASHSDTGHLHRDSKILLSAVTYLNKDSTNSGTSIYSSKKINTFQLDQDTINQGYQTKNDPEWQNYVNSKTENFVEIARVNNVYNSMIIFNGYRAHKAHLKSPTATEDRLTIVTFVRSILAAENPKERSRLVNCFT
jgi:hypothetical protein